jgi:hypothetical protein
VGHQARTAARVPVGKALIALGLCLAWLLVVVQPAGADTIQFTGQGTNANGTCGEFEGSPPPPGGTQTWQFNLTQTNSGATMSASFSDGTTVTNLAENTHNGSTSMWFITTAAGASVNSASASFTPSGPNPQFVVSHCTAGGTPPPSSTSPPGTTSPPATTRPPGTTSPPGTTVVAGGAAAGASSAAPVPPSPAASVTGQPRTTG